MIHIIPTSENSFEVCEIKRHGILLIRMIVTFAPSAPDAKRMREALRDYREHFENSARDEDSQAACRMRMDRLFAEMMQIHGPALIRTGIGPFRLANAIAHVLFRLTWPGLVFGGVVALMGLGALMLVGAWRLLGHG